MKFSKDRHHQWIHLGEVEVMRELSSGRKSRHWRLTGMSDSIRAERSSSLRPVASKSVSTAAVQLIYVNEGMPFVSSLFTNEIGHSDAKNANCLDFFVRLSN